MLSVSLTRAANGTVVVPVLIGEAPPEPTRQAASVAGFTGRAGELCEVFAPAGHTLLIGLGRDPDISGCRDAGSTAAARLGRLDRFTLDARALRPSHAAALAAGACLRAWRFDRLKTRPEEDTPRLAAIDLLVNELAAAATAWTQAEAAVTGALFARDLVAEPANHLTPQSFVERLRGLAGDGVTLEVLKPSALRRQGLQALLAVGSGSAQQPRLAVLRWQGSNGAAPVAFVGKGITFDTGGLCIKPADQMWEMRADMAGAAACAGAVLALARRRSPAAAVAVLALAENATGAASYRPGDVLRSYAGRTIEVIDTDAEGRLVLADALAWTARRIRPRAMIDLATLTGSVVVALGHEMAGMFDNSASLAAHVAAAASLEAEPVWRLPIGARHRTDLESPIADLRNCCTGRMQPDACHAAAFLREFAGDTPWVHLDIAGMESKEAEDDQHARGPTGFGVRLLNRLVAMHFEDDV